MRNLAVFVGHGWRPIAAHRLTSLRQSDSVRRIGSDDSRYLCCAETYTRSKLGDGGKRKKRGGKAVPVAKLMLI